MKPSKEAIKRIAKESGGIVSRYGDVFGFNMSNVALARFADKVREPLIHWIKEEGERTDVCTKNITGDVCTYCKCKHKGD